MQRDDAPILEIDPSPTAVIEPTEHIDPTEIGLVPVYELNVAGSRLAEAALRP